MSLSDQQNAQSALSREWLIARMVVLGGLIVAAAAVAYFGWLQPYLAQRAAVSNAQARAHALSIAITDLCDSGLEAAKNYGIVPNYGRVAGNKVFTTNVQGRYVCVAVTPSTRYLIVVDLVCRQLKDRRCVSLFSVRQTDGTVLYQRQG